MKLIMGLMAAVFAVSLTGCNQLKDGFNGNSNTNPANVTPAVYPGVLQGKIIDATTGQPISGTDTQITLVQGLSNRSPDKYISDSANSLAGEYAFANMPVEPTANNMYKIVVVKTGYQRFESEFTYKATLGGTVTAPGTGNVASITSTPSYNMIGDIYLFPVGAVAAPIKVTVVDQNAKAVAGVTVQLVQTPNGNSAATSTTAGTRLTATNGLLANLTATTDASGLATFAATNLTLGAQYTPIALATASLTTTTGSTITVGMNNGALNSAYAQNITMATSSFGALAVVAQSNSPSAVPNGTGVLNAVFNQAFTLDSPNTATPWTAVLTATGVPAIAPASLVASATAAVTGSSLVVTPTLPTWFNTTAVSSASITYTYTGNAYVTSTGVNNANLTVLANKTVVIK